VFLVFKTNKNNTWIFSALKTSVKGHKNAKFSE